MSNAFDGGWQSQVSPTRINKWWKIMKCRPWKAWFSCPLSQLPLFQIYWKCYQLGTQMGFKLVQVGAFETRKLVKVMLKNVMKKNVQKWSNKRIPNKRFFPNSDSSLKGSSGVFRDPSDLRTGSWRVAAARIHGERRLRIAVIYLHSVTWLSKTPRKVTTWDANFKPNDHFWVKIPKNIGLF